MQQEQVVTKTASDKIGRQNIVTKQAADDERQTTMTMAGDKRRV